MKVKRQFKLAPEGRFAGAYHLLLGRQYPRTRDTLDVRIYVNNYIGISLVFFGCGIRAWFRIRKPKV